MTAAIRARWREAGWTVAVVALLVVATQIPPLLVVALIPSLDRAFANYHRHRGET